MERRKPNLLQMLHSREVHGSFLRGRPAIHNKAIKLFGSIPARFIFVLRAVLDCRTEHIVLGITRCGQFIVTYSYTTEERHQNITTIDSQYKYRLHWWAFRGTAPALKVAEVQLFDSQDVGDPLNIGIAQWPNINDRLIVYGYTDEGDDVDMETHSDPADMANRKYYITVTTLPSLHNCRDCKAVAESFDEEDMVGILDSAFSFSCLKHGLTIHTTLDVAPPYPKLDPRTSFKVDNKIIVNAGNFLHVLSFAVDKEEKTSCERDTIVPEETPHRIGEMLSNCIKNYNCPWKKPGNTSSLNMLRPTRVTSINNAWLNTIMDRANKVYAFEESDDGCEPRFKWYKKRRLADKMYEFCCDDEDMENICPPAKRPRLDVFEEREEKCDLSMPLVYPERPIFFKTLSPNFHKAKSEQSGINNKVSVPNNSVCDSNIIEKCNNMSLNTTVCQEGREKNVNVPQQNSVDTDFRLYPQNNLNSSPNSSIINVSPDKPVSSVNEIRQNFADTNCRSSPNFLNNVSKSSNTPGTLPCNNPPVSSTSEIKPVPSRSDLNIPPLNISVINPDLSAILAEWEAESVSSLSPRSDSLSKNDVIQSFLELIPGMTVSPRSSGSSSSTGINETPTLKLNDNTRSAIRVSSPNSSVNKYSPFLVVLRTRNCNQDKKPQKMKEQENRLKAFSKEEIVSKVKPTKEPDVSLRQRMISGCSVSFDRIYIELDDEIISTISTDFEDDDQGTGFHCALPLSVHGSAYAQLQMVSIQKAEKLSMDCERVFQSSLDIEQFCFKAADIICKYEGFKFWFCSDYDVELIDVSGFNGDILGVVCMRVNAEKKTAKNENYSRASRRHFYGIKCVFVWNPVGDRCWLEAYSPLVETRQMGQAWESPARREAMRLRQFLQTTTLFTLPPYPAIRTFEHRMWKSGVLRPSVEELRDLRNLICFRLYPRSSAGRRSSLRDRNVAEFWG